MNDKRVNLGFDLRVNPEVQEENPSQLDQRLVPNLRSPISADPNVWVTTAEIESLSQGELPEFFNPLHLSSSLGHLIDTCQRKHASTIGLWPLSLTCYETNLLSLVRRYGPGYFDNPIEENELLAQGWQFKGFDVVDLEGLISGLKGCGYTEPMWSELRNRFANSLNEMGLFSEISTASQFAEVRGLEIRAHAPFVIVGVLTQKSVGDCL